MMEHRTAQKSGKDSLFESYRIRVAEVLRDYTDISRDNAPA
jgi:heme-degrading monooxygenase HmoA